MCRPSSKTTTNFQREKSYRRIKNFQRQQHKPLTPPPLQLAGKSRLATEIKCRFCLVLFKRLASMEDRSESSSPPAASSSSEELEQLSRRSNVGDFTAEEVMSEVHLGCPPGLSGSHYSQFTFSLPTGNSLPSWAPLSFSHRLRILKTSHFGFSLQNSVTN